MSDYFDRIERQLVRSVEAGLPRSSRVRIHHLVSAAAVVVVVAVVAVFLGARGSGPSRSGVAGRSGSVTVAFTTATSSGSALERTIEILGKRIDAAFPGAQVSHAGNEVLVTAHGTRARILALAAPGQLEFYDWEANALTPNGRTVASQLQRNDPASLAVSQGNGASPGAPGAGSLSLYDAVKLASRQPAEPSSDNAHTGPAYYLFGSCAGRAHCLLSGPAASERELFAGVPASPGGQVLVVPRGIVVLQATASFAHPALGPKASFVLRDHVALSGTELTSPQQIIDQSGSPDVTFGFTSQGGLAFHRFTSILAHRGNLVSGLGQALCQHFAVALDGRLITVPLIDFEIYPDGLQANTGADITDGLTRQSARDLATVLRFGPLPANLVARP